MDIVKTKTKNSILSYPDYDKDVSSSPITFNSKKKLETKWKILISLGTVFGLIAIAMLVIIFINLQADYIFNNISIDGLDVSYLTSAEAIKKVTDEKNALLNRNITIACEDITETISATDIEIKYDIEGSVEKAYSIGRFGDIFSNNFGMIKANFQETNIDCEYTYNEEKLNAIVNSITSQLPQLENVSYEIVDKNLVINSGKAGLMINVDKVKNDIIDVIQNDKANLVTIPAAVVNPDAINIEKIHEEIYKEPIDASYQSDPFEIFPHQEGVDFAVSMEEAKEMLQEVKEEYIIALNFTTPNITTDQIGSEAFPDLLSSFETTYIKEKYNRTENLRLASKAINEMVIMPGEVFSYNKALGPRTAERGYKEAGVYSGGRVVDGLGGGICQISSTLYNIVLLANLEIIERHNHQFLPGYVGAGRDATVVYGALDFKFKNTRNYPIKIQSSVDNGYVRMKLFGKKEDNEYDVSFSTTILSTLYQQTVYEDTYSLAPGETRVSSYGENGCKSVTYMILSQNGVEVSRKQLSSDTYSAMNTYVLRGVGSSSSSSSSSNSNSEESSNSSTQEPDIETGTVESSSSESSTSTETSSSGVVDDAVPTGSGNELMQ